MSAVKEQRSDNLHQGDGGGDGGNDHQQVEHHAEEGAAGTHVGEHILQGDEQELGAAQDHVAVGDAAGHGVGNGSGDNGQTGQQSNDGIGHNNDQGVLGQVLLLTQVGAVSNHGAHGQGQGEEHLAAGAAQNLHEAGRLGNEACGHRIAGNEHELQAFHCAGQGQGADDNDDEHHKQGRHTHLVELLDAAGNAALDDQHADDHKHQREHEAAEGVGEHGAEGGAAADGTAKNAAEAEAQLCQVQGHVLQAVAAQNGVEAHDQEGSQNAQEAQPFEFLAGLFVSAQHAPAGLAAQSQLTDHNGHAHKYSQQQINDQKSKTAAGAHLVGEAPDVAQTDSRTNSSQQEAQVTGPGTAIVLHKNLLSKIQNTSANMRSLLRKLIITFCLLFS